MNTVSIDSNPLPSMKSYSYVLLSVLILISSAGCAARRTICEDFRVVVVGNEFKILANCWKEVDMGLLDDITVFDAHLHNRCQDGKYDWWNLPVVPTNDTVRVQREKDRSFVLAFPCRGPTHFHSDFIDINTNDDNPCLVLPHCEWIGHKDGEILVGTTIDLEHLSPYLKMKSKQCPMKGRLRFKPPHYLDSTKSNLVYLAYRKAKEGESGLWRYSVMISDFLGLDARELANVDSHVWEPIRNGLSTNEGGCWSVAFARKFTYNSEEGCKVSEVRVITGDCNKVISDKTVAVSGKEHMLPFGNFFNWGEGAYCDENNLIILRAHEWKTKPSGFFTQSHFFPCDMKICTLDLNTGKWTYVPVEFPPNEK